MMRTARNKPIPLEVSAKGQFMTPLMVKHFNQCKALEEFQTPQGAPASSDLREATGHADVTGVLEVHLLEHAL
jgi:hypothetical protein